MPSGILFGSSSSTSRREGLFWTIFFENDPHARGSFSKKSCPKRTFPSDFVKLGSEILYLFLAEKIVVCFVCFVATLSDFGLLVLKIEVLFELRKILMRKKYSMYGLGTAQPLRYPDSADLQRCN